MMMEEIANQLDQVREEMAHLLQAYATADDTSREHIYERCESLGGEIQELVGLLKMTIYNANREAEAERDTDPAYALEIAELSRDSLAAIHAAGREVSAAITLLRSAHDDPDELC
jgi:hypothetical protein